MHTRAIISALFRSPLRWLTLGLFLSASVASVHAERGPITKAGQVHDLPAEQAAEQLPVHLIATVTYYEPGENTLFVADSSGAVYVRTTHPYPIHRGDLVQIDGFTAKSYRTTIADDPQIKVIGTGVIRRENIRTYESYRQLMSGTWDCQYVVMHGTIRAAIVEAHANVPVLEIEVLMPGGIVQAFVQNFTGIDLTSLDGAEVEISGIVAGNFNARWQLMRAVIYAADAGDLRIIRKATLSADTLPLTPIDDIMQTHSIDDRTKRVRVQGVVTYYREGNSVVIQQNGRSLYASTRQITPIPLGSVVDVVGFASEGGYGPTLAQGEIFPTGGFSTVTPNPVTFQQAVSGVFSDNLISLRGRIIAQLHTDSSDSLSLMVDDHVVVAVLQQPASNHGLPKLPLGAEVSVVGICRITPDTLWGTPGVATMLFQVNLRSREDIRVVALPTWWTVAHLLDVIGVLFVISLIIAIWALVLRRRVTRQTATIERAMHLERERSRLLEAINSESSLEELLTTILGSIEAQVPGLKCSCDLSDHTHDTHDTHDTTAPTLAMVIGEDALHPVFEAPLTDGKGRVMGTFRASADSATILTKHEEEVLKVGTGLANLAINQRRMYQELNYNSTHDQLTGLPNRRLADVCLENALKEAVANGSRLAVAYIDVDRFKQVNDQHGHKVGDLYLQQIASRLSSQIRITDRLARIGGDEFICIATQLRSSEDAEAYRCRLESCFEQSFVLDGCRVSGSASIGIAVFPDHGSAAEDLKRHADIDMYSAKGRRRADLGERSNHGETDIFTRADLEAALESGSFTLFYQPQFSSKGDLRGLEALIRLKDPILGIVSPDAFIGVAERNDVILPLGAWVLRQALADAVRWRFDTLDDVRMVVNVSARQIEHPGFAELVDEILEDSGLPARCLELEITERTLARNIAEANRQLVLLHANGVRISIDDFGTDHSCLSALHRYPVDTLKIDRSFVRALHTEPEVRHVIRAIISMGQSMNKRIVAEGVETEEDIDAILRFADVDLQGFFFSRPQPSEVIAANLNAWCSGVAMKK